MMLDNNLIYGLRVLGFTVIAFFIGVCLAGGLLWLIR